MPKIIDGKALARLYLQETESYIQKNRLRPKLVTVLTGNDQASETYVRIKKATCGSIGIDVDVHRTATEKETLAMIKKLNADESVNGILVQLPVPFDEKKILDSIDPSKDADGVHPANIGKLAHGDESMPACTAYGIIKILEGENLKLDGANVAILGRGIHVGIPLSIMLTNRNATVSVCHSKTQNTPDVTRNADIVIVAIGKPGYLTGEMIKNGAVVIDVGINRVNGKIKGDADFDSVKNKAKSITPVPGGVGPMTVAMLARNVLNAYKTQHGILHEKD